MLAGIVWILPLGLLLRGEEKGVLAGMDDTGSSMLGRPLHSGSPSRQAPGRSRRTTEEAGRQRRYAWAEFRNLRCNALVPRLALRNGPCNADVYII